MKLIFSGASQEVTGSCYFVELSNGTKIVVDAGLFQGNGESEAKNAADFPFDPKEVKYLLVTHAHLDHTGRIPKLIENGFKGKIYSTEPTRDLAKIVLEDSVELMEEAAQREGVLPLYDRKDVANCFPLWNIIDYGEWIELEPGIRFYLRDDGHILGSSSITLEADGQKVTFSGDIGNPPVPFLRAIEFVDKTDSLVIESTYGGRIHEPSEKRLSLLKESIIETVNRGGTLMIPVFAIERAQEILYELNQLAESNQIPDIPIYLDSPMAIDTTRVFRRFEELFNEKDRVSMRIDDPFQFPGLHFTQTSIQSKEINKVTGPKIIAAGAGMMNGGRILHHAIRYLPDEKSELLFVGFQVIGSIGRRLIDGEKTIKIHGQDVPVKARIKAIGAYSGHGDQPGLLNYIEQIKEKPKKIFITHGELEQSQILAQKIEEKFGIKAIVPMLGETVEL